MKCKDCKEEGCPFRCYTEEGECSYVDFNEDSFDWKSFRTEAAKDILCAMVSQRVYGEDKTILYQSELAIKYADILISKLKEEEEK